MIRELISYFTTSATDEAKAFGHLYESISLIEREKRCSHHWLPHRTKCKNTILKIQSKIPNHKSVLVLGSGPLHEFPIEEMADIFEQIDLVDVVHLKKTKDQYKHLRNVRFIEKDITELESIILKEKKVRNLTPTQFLDNNYDLVISANLMSQLSIHLRKFLEKKSSPKLSDLELDQFANQVSLDHFQYLTNFNCPVLLITDTETQFIGINDEILDTDRPYINFPLPKSHDDWWWNVAPRPEYSKDYSVRMKVSVFVLNFSGNPTLIK